VKVHFGEEAGEIVALVEPDQEHNVFITHNALSRLHPNVRKFILVAAETGELSEAASAAGLSRVQVETILPRLRALLGDGIRA
jgi:hypothetical protein